MKLVADTNILISAFVSDLTTRHLIRDLDADIYAPENLREEVEKYDDLIQEKSGLTESELTSLKSRLFNYIEFIPDDELNPFRDQAVEAIGETDEDDVIHVALPCGDIHATSLHTVATVSLIARPGAYVLSYL